MLLKKIQFSRINIPFTEEMRRMVEVERIIQTMLLADQMQARRQHWEKEEKIIFFFSPQCWLRRV